MAVHDRLIHQGQYCEVTLVRASEIGYFLQFTVTDGSKVIRRFEEESIAIEFAKLYDQGV